MTECLLASETNTQVSDRLRAANQRAALPSRGVGIDIESVTTPVNRDAVLAVALGPGEWTYLSGQTRLSPDQYLSLAFSAKDRFFKAAFGVVGH
jgi:4'-phosphopantetheinyl transferase EntD